MEQRIESLTPIYFKMELGASKETGQKLYSLTIWKLKPNQQWNADYGLIALLQVAQLGQLKFHKTILEELIMLIVVVQLLE